MIKKIILIILLVISYPSFSQKDSISQNQAIEKIQIIDTLSEAEAYKLLYENTQEANSKILSTIYWAIGGIFTVILAIIGTSVFFNYRFNKKEVENISSEAISQIENAKYKFSNEIEEKLNKFIIETTENLKLEENNLSNSYKDLLKSYSDNLNNQIRSNKEALELKITSFDKSIRLSQKEIEEELKNFKILSETKSKILKLSVNNNEAQLWEMKKVPSNALRCYIDELVSSMEIKFYFNIGYRTADIVRVLKEMSEIKDALKKDLMELLEKFPEDYSNQKQLIEDALNNVVVK